MKEIQELADTIRRRNIRIMGIIEGEEKKQGLEKRGLKDPNLQRGMEIRHKQKTAYEISACLVGSEMCIRDRYKN